MIDRAIDLAKSSEYFQFKVGCIIVDKKGRTISTGTNKRKTHPMQKRMASQVTGNMHTGQVYLHAEMAALVKVRKQPHTIYVARWRRNNTTGLAKPCPICFQAILESGCKRIVYTTSNNGFEIIDL